MVRYMKFTEVKGLLSKVKELKCPICGSQDIEIKKLHWDGRYEVSFLGWRGALRIEGKCLKCGTRLEVVFMRKWGRTRSFLIEAIFEEEAEKHERN